ncbi:ependymin-related protein 1-like [Haliotis asinina]|uniref:ependymin-related protein 1-like n=1 Tax=Haliotis asinina TaxID=109174 RepID=UPI003531F490
MMLQAILLASLATVALGSICCAPQQWEGFEAVSNLDASGIDRYLLSYSYDAINQRYAINDNYTSLVSARKEIWDYRQGIVFRINTEKRTCETFTVTGTFPASCIPSGAVDMGPFFYGLGTDTLSARAYQFNDTTGEFKNIVAVVTARGCFPITRTTVILRPGSGNNVLRVACVNNILPGIRDSTNLRPPILL